MKHAISRFYQQPTTPLKVLTVYQNMASLGCRDKSWDNDLPKLLMIVKNTHI